MSFIDNVAVLTALFLEEMSYFVLTNQSSCLLPKQADAVF